MSTDQEDKLSRAVSSVDLNAALTETAQKDYASRYTKEELLSLRPKEDDNHKSEEHVEVTDLGPDGLATPPSHKSPNPPPPTPDATSEAAAIENFLKEAKESEGEVKPDVGVEEAPKKKKKKKSSKTKKQVTGFEEFYADPPLTPDEYNEERDMYDPSRPFHERMETCIQRFRARRNLDSARSNIFTKFIMLGGVEATAKSFTGGLDQNTLDNATTAEIRAMQAHDYIRPGSKKYYDPSDSENWVVDWEGVAAGFFSYRVPQVFALDTEEELKLITSVIRNFYNYVLGHAVCTEYTLQIMAARRLCDAAEKELWAMKEVRSVLPGDFNVAASTLYGGCFEGVHISAQPWREDEPEQDQWFGLQAGQSVAEAERIFKTAIAFAGTDELFTRVMAMDCRIVKTETKAYELVGIKRADIKTLSDYSGITDHENRVGSIKALGTMTVKSWEGPGFDNEDFTDDEGTGIPPPLEEVTETFWLEDDILRLLYVGLKMELKVHELSVGIKFFDQVVGLYCSFHKVLPNEKMGGWKEPVLSTRPPPTEYDPDLEERAMEADINGDIADDEKIKL